MKDPTETMMRVKEGAKIAGVCTGLAKFADMDPTIIRIIFVCFAFLQGMGLLFYLILWAVMPSDQD